MLLLPSGDSTQNRLNRKNQGKEKDAAFRSAVVLGETEEQRPTQITLRISPGFYSSDLNPVAIIGR
jgi:hypothetical protein